MVALKSLVGTLVACLLVLPACYPQTSVDERWAVRMAGRDNGSHFPFSVPKVTCGSLEFFQDNLSPDVYNSRGFKMPQPFKATSTSRVGEVKGRAIYTVFYGMRTKVIVVERNSNEFCAVFTSDALSTLWSAEPAYLVDADSQTVLVSRDPVDGNCGCYERAYWGFDDDGPFFLDVFEIDDALTRLLPAGLFAGRAAEFDEKTLTYSGPASKPTDCGACATGGSFSIRFAIRDHHFVVASQNFDPTPLQRYSPSR